jgi:hypothetical protein
MIFKLPFPPHPSYQDTPLAQPVAGTPETVASLSKSSLVDFMKGNFTGSRMAVAGTGGVTAEGLAAGVGAWSVGSGAVGALDAPAVPSVFTGSDVRARFDSYPVRKGREWVVVLVGEEEKVGGRRGLLRV